jgi:hypothetical protein
MSRPSPNNRARRRASAKKSSWGPIVATAAACLVVFGFLAFTMNRTPAPSASATQAAPATAASDTRVALKPTAPANPVLTAAKATAQSRQSATSAKRDVPGSALASNTEPAAPAVSHPGPLSAADRAKLVQAQIVAGEFGPALQTAKSATSCSRPAPTCRRRPATGKRPTFRSAAFRFPNRVIRRAPKTPLVRPRPAVRLRRPCSSTCSRTQPATRMTGQTKKDCGRRRSTGRPVSKSTRTVCCAV